MHFLFGILFLIVSLTVHAEGYSDTPDEVAQKVLYLSYDDVPQRLMQGELFAIRIKTLSTLDSEYEIVYRFKNGRGVKLFTEEPIREIRGKYYFDTFYFIANRQKIRTPDITAVIKYSDFYEAYPTVLEGRKLDVITLNPDTNYAHILADDFSVLLAKTTQYDNQSNIVVFRAEASRSNLETFHFNDALKQGFESIINHYDRSSMTYFAIIPSKLESVKFSYFNLEKKRFVNVIIPIIIDNDTVSTQSDLKPIERKHTMLKISAAGVVIFIGLVLLLLRRRLWYLILIIIPGLYIAYASIPIQHACIKEGSPIYLLPMKHGTIFEITPSEYILEIQGSVTDFTKVKLHNNNIGWIKNEDLCTP
ncbi:MAG: hypothetical protein DRG24_03890 [Epsilonproteobacteria bacterium]|nr:MAG: hypothetical protein DRG24_03890 [Campylobacterota bacterium]